MWVGDIFGYNIRKSIRVFHWLPFLSHLSLFSILLDNSIIPSDENYPKMEMHCLAAKPRPVSISAYPKLIDALLNQSE
jgi:hypothetical protein